MLGMESLGLTFNGKITKRKGEGEEGGEERRRGREGDKEGSGEGGREGKGREGKEGGGEGGREGGRWGGRRNLSTRRVLSF